MSCMFLHIKAKAGSKTNKAEMTAGGVVIRIKAPAQEGKANDELIRFLSEKLGLPKSKIRIASGQHAPFKKLEIDAEESEVFKKLGL